tara:strand:+ start:249 stop:590 length:342 start_codon:yes stop_codon:yes gene_type:complete
MNKELKQIVKQVEWDAENSHVKLQDIKEALDFVTNDQYGEHGQIDYSDIHYRNMQAFFNETNDGESSDWHWEEVIPFWRVEDIESALEDWEFSNCPDDQESREQAYEELEAAE